MSKNLANTVVFARIRPEMLKDLLKIDVFSTALLENPVNIAISGPQRQKTL